MSGVLKKGERERIREREREREKDCKKKTYRLKCIWGGGKNERDRLKKESKIGRYHMEEKLSNCQELIVRNRREIKKKLNRSRKEELRNEFLCNRIAFPEKRF